jgi:hypothetical protein
MSIPLHIVHSPFPFQSLHLNESCGVVIEVVWHMIFTLSCNDLRTLMKEQTSRILQLLEEMREADADRNISKVEC